MKKIIALFLLSFACVAIIQAQSRVFKQVAEEMSSDMQTITQDGAVVGYVVLTKLEKANADSFNYKLSLMDENLNDIGEIKQKDVNMSLMGVAFEQDVLCLSYLKSNVGGVTFTNRKEFKNAKEGATNVISNQFVTLEGKVISTHNFPIEVNVDFAYTGSKRKVVATAQLKNNGQIKNIPGKGFCFLYGDKDKTEIIAYENKGEVKWKKTLDRYDFYSIVTTADVLYVLGKVNKSNNSYCGYELDRFAVTDGKKGEKYILEDQNRNGFQVLNFETNQITGKPFIAGNIIGKHFKAYWESGKSHNKGMYKGVFSLTLNGIAKKDVKENITYWSDGAFKPDFAGNGFSKSSKTFPVLATASQDSAGNVYFAGTTLRKKFRVGAVITSVLLIPTIIMPPAIMAVTGTHKYKYQDAVIVKQGNKGSLYIDQTLEKNKSHYYQAKYPLVGYDTPNDFTTIYTAATKSDVIIFKDASSYNIYSLAKKQVTRKIPYTLGKSSIRIAGAKEGHIMVLENNYKEKYTKLSIEPI
jgi:hypothetical protein